MSSENDRVVFEALLPIILKEPADLTDDDVRMLVEAQKVIGRVLTNLTVFISFGLPEIRRYRSRREFLDQLSTSELRAKMDEIQQVRARTPGDDEEPPDTSPVIPGSDEAIVAELLLERG